MKTIDRFGPIIFGEKWPAAKEALVVVDVSNVAQWFHEENPQEVWDWREDFPSMVAPWMHTWAEYRVPKYSNNEGTIAPFRTVFTERVAVLTETLEIPEAARGQGVDLIAVRMKLMYPRITSYPRVKNDLTKAHWAVVARLHIEGQNGRLAPTLIENTFYLDSDGRFMDDTLRRSVGKEQFAEEVYAGLDGLFFPVWFAFSLLHCKNVTTVDHQIPPKVAAKRKRNGKEPGVAYKTLEVGPMRQTLRTQGQSDEVGLKKAMHICRGHFATYTPDKPLFGRVTGTFWKPMHTRGNKAHGEVIKDYKVKAREDERGTA